MFDDIDDSYFTKIALHFPEYAKIEEYVSNLSSLHPDVVKEFQIMLSPNETVERKLKAKEKVLKIKSPFNSTKKLTTDENEFFHVLVEKMNFTHITPCTIPKMFSLISSRIPKDSEEIPEEIEKLFIFLQVCGYFYTSSRLVFLL